MGISKSKLISSLVFYCFCCVRNFNPTVKPFENIGLVIHVIARGFLSPPFHHWGPYNKHCTHLPVTVLISHLFSLIPSNLSFISCSIIDVGAAFIAGDKFCERCLAGSSPSKACKVIDNGYDVEVEIEVVSGQLNSEGGDLVKDSIRNSRREVEGREKAKEKVVREEGWVFKPR